MQGHARILIVDRFPSFRQNLARYLALLDADYEIVGEAATDEFAVEEIGRLHPDIVLLDLDLPDRSGLLTTRHIRRTWPATAVIAITDQPSDDYRRAALEAGASDCLDKFALVEELPAVLARAARTFIIRPAPPPPGDSPALP